MIDVLICGINGNMGKAVYAAAEKRKDINVTCGVDRHVLGGFDCPVHHDFTEVNEHVDAIIDFSSPSALPSVISFAEENRCALVIATTGYSESDKAEIRKISRLVPVCMSPNMSFGMTAVAKILPQLKELLKNFDVSITEIHGKNKKDKPSGTALALKNLIGDGKTDILSVRGGDIPGVHEIVFSGNKEQISVKHTAFSREIFAEGALDACLKTASSPPALYDFFE